LRADDYFFYLEKNHNYIHMVFRKCFANFTFVVCKNQKLAKTCIRVCKNQKLADVPFYASSHFDKRSTLFSLPTPFLVSFFACFNEKCIRISKLTFLVFESEEGTFMHFTCVRKPFETHKYFFLTQLSIAIATTSNNFDLRNRRN
jgi:hypothetical protein